jgi:protein ImuB
MLDGLIGVLDSLAATLCADLERRGAGGRTFEACFFRVDGACPRVTIETAAPTRDPGVLIRLFRLRIDALADPINPGFGFDAVRLAIGRSEPLALRQDDLAGAPHEAADAHAIAALVDRLIARFGARFGHDSVQRFITRDTHDPVRAGAAVPYLATAASDPWPQPEPGRPPARPLTLFPEPQPIEAVAEVPDGPPLRFRWRRVLHTVARAEGPERIAPEWWRVGGGDLATRDYYCVEDETGHRFWLFRDGLYTAPHARPRWFLHGLFA